MKKYLILFIAMAVILPSALVAVPVSADEDIQVCGVDGATYESASAAEEAGIEVSYEFACVDEQSEDGLYEETADINFAGMLIEIGSTDVPTTIIVRDNSDSSDYTVEVTEDTILGQRRDQYTQLSNWIPGDQIKVVGVKNENTETITASMLINLSIVVNKNKGANGWITAVDKDARTITYQWMNKNHTFAYDDDTRFVAGLINPASVDDLEVNDRIRARLLLRQCVTTPCDPLAKIVVVLRRGSNLFMKIRTFRPNAELVSLDSTIVPTTIEIKILETPGLEENDVNNLIGTEGTIVTVNITEDTKIVRKYFGRTTLSEFSIGDKLHVVGRYNDDGTVDAKILKNNTIWRTSSKGHIGVVKEVNTESGYIMVNWTPVKHVTLKKLKEKADQEGENIDKEKLVTRLPIKRITVNIGEDTTILVGTDTNAEISDINIGDKIRFRGVRIGNPPSVNAETIVIVNSLPEIEVLEE